MIASLGSLGRFGPGVKPQFSFHALILGGSWDLVIKVISSFTGGYKQL